MEREFEVIGTQPLRFKGDYVQPGDTFKALPEEVAFYLQIGALAPTSDAPIEPSDPEVVRRTLRRNAKENRGGIDSVVATPSANPGRSIRRPVTTKSKE